MVEEREKKKKPKEILNDVTNVRQHKYGEGYKEGSGKGTRRGDVL